MCIKHVQILAVTNVFDDMIQFAEITENCLLKKLISNNIVYIHVYSEKYIPTCRCELTNQMSYLSEVNN